MFDNTLIHNDCIKAMGNLPAETFDAVVTDPPYELGFAGRAWDRTGIAFRPETWASCLRLAKPGAWLLAFGGTRTYHRLACAIETAGWEIRDCIMWLYGSGYPKSRNLTGRWAGWGTCLKPAYEPILVARKPFAGTVTDNVATHGCGALNIDGCRVPAEKATGWKGRGAVAGRWPANIMHDGSEEVLRHFPLDRVSRMKQAGEPLSAARFFYCPKASIHDRDEGLDKLPAEDRTIFGLKDRKTIGRNLHPTVKPTALMRYLCRMVTPPAGHILDPFAGSGSTGKAVILEGFRFTGIEKEAMYARIARARMAYAEEVYDQQKQAPVHAGA